jgi:hypothetical protein
MTENNEKKNLFSMWYDFSNGIGKQLLEMSNMGNLNYVKLNDSWKGYSERINDQLLNLMKVDENYYKDVMQLWNDFSENMNEQISSMGAYEPPSYTRWYDYWLEYGDKFSKDFNNAIQKHWVSQSDLYEVNDLWVKNFNLNDDQKEMIMESSKAISNYWFDVMTQVTNLIKDYTKFEKGTDLANRYKEFYDDWAKTYSTLMEQLSKNSPLELWKDFKPNEDFLGMGIIQKFIKENLKIFNLNKKYDNENLTDELDRLNQEVERLAAELDEYKNKSGSSYRGRRKKR